MARIKPLEIKKKESSAGKWVFILILCALAFSAYMRRDDLMHKVHEIVHGQQQAEQPPVAASMTAQAPATAAIPAPAPAFVPVSTPDNPCGAYVNDAAQLAICKDQQQKIQRMKDAAAARDKAFEQPPPRVLPTPGQPGTNTTGK